MFGLLTGLFRRDSSREAIDRLHERIAEWSRNPALYGHRGLPDTLPGRFESLVLHMVLVLRRLRELPEPAADVAQDLVDAVFRHLDVGMREAGVSDVGVPKRIKTYAAAFYDRIAAYDRLLPTGDPAAIAAEIGRRVDLGGPVDERIAAYALSAEARLRNVGLDDLIGGSLMFPDPSTIPGERRS